MLSNDDESSYLSSSKEQEAQEEHASRLTPEAEHGARTRQLITALAHTVLGPVSSSPLWPQAAP